jgi:hypothetical protein
MRRYFHLFLRYFAAAIPRCFFTQCFTKEINNNKQLTMVSNVSATAATALSKETISAKEVEKATTEFTDVEKILSWPRLQRDYTLLIRIICINFAGIIFISKNLTF